jgi:hypothetical protein
VSQPHTLTRAALAQTKHNLTVARYKDRIHEITTRNAELETSLRVLETELVDARARVASAMASVVSAAKSAPASSPARTAPPVEAPPTPNSTPSVSVVRPTKGGVVTESVDADGKTVQHLECDRYLALFAPGLMRARTETARL